MTHIILNVKIYKGLFDCYATIAGYDHFELSTNKQVAIEKMKALVHRRYPNGVKITINDKTLSKSAV
jgi:hypothetical protein